MDKMVNQQEITMRIFQNFLRDYCVLTTVYCLVSKKYSPTLNESLMVFRCFDSMGFDTIDLTMS